jgi:hypothetical protein
MLPTLILTILHSAIFLAQGNIQGQWVSAPSDPLHFEMNLPDNPSRKGFVVRVDRDRQYQGPFPEDHLVLSVHPPRTELKPVVEYGFASSYTFDLKMMDVTGDGVEEIVLITGSGRGTSVRKETLAVLQWRASNISTLLSVPLSGFCGLNREWRYRLTFPQNQQNEPMHIALSLELPNDMDLVCDLEMLPSFSVIEYQWSIHDKRMIPIRSVQRSK